MERLNIILALLAVTAASTKGAATPPQRFQADRFLDMLAKTFDPKVAYADLLAALQLRLGVEPTAPAPISNITDAVPPPDAGVGNPSVLETVINCPEVQPIQGTVVTYTSDPHVRGSRAFYQCEVGYTGQSRFVQCDNGGVWSSLNGYSGCVPVDCGSPAPTVAHATSSMMASTYGSAAVYTCEQGYKGSIDDVMNVTCLANGQWTQPFFTCDKISVPQLNPSSLGGLSALFGGGQGSQGAGSGAAANPMMEALMKSMQSLGKMGGAQQGAATPTAPANNPMMANLAKLFPNMMPSPRPTTTPAPPVQQNTGMAGGFQLPSHLQSLLPNGMSNINGINTNDLMALATAGLGSANPASAPRNINQLIGSMNPMQALFGGGLGAPGGGAGVGGPGMVPDPEKAAEQREEMMMRAMMASAMKSMMAPRPNQSGGNSTGAAKQQNPLMALQNSLGGGGGGGMGAGAMDPSMMGMLGGMNPSMLGLGGGGNPMASLFGGGGGGAGMFGGLGSLFGA